LPSDPWDEVCGFIELCIPSVQHAEILILLLQTAPKTWTAERAAVTLALPVRVAAQALEDLGARNLLDVKLADDVYYGFVPGTPELARRAGAFADAYRDQHAATLHQILSKPSRGIRAFADAFRLRRPPRE
jgi:hypothetical protein